MRRAQKYMVETKGIGTSVIVAIIVFLAIAGIGGYLVLKREEKEIVPAPTQFYTIAPADVVLTLADLPDGWVAAGEGVAHSTGMPKFDVYFDTGFYRNFGFVVGERGYMVQSNAFRFKSVDGANAYFDGLVGAESFDRVGDESVIFRNLPGNLVTTFFRKGNFIVSSTFPLDRFSEADIVGYMQLVAGRIK